jgi:hypothetical protein
VVAPVLHDHGLSPLSRIDPAQLLPCFKLLEAAETRWRAVNGPHLVALVRAGATVKKGVLVERPTEAVNPDPEKAAA